MRAGSFLAAAEADDRVENYDNCAFVTQTLRVNIIYQRGRMTSFLCASVVNHFHTTEANATGTRVERGVQSKTRVSVYERVVGARKHCFYRNGH